LVAASLSSRLSIMGSLWAVRRQIKQRMLLWLHLWQQSCRQRLFLRSVIGALAMPIFVFYGTGGLALSSASSWLNLQHRTSGEAY
jgi:hypothetical protein